jgi:folate-binding protein YgfZ
MSESDVAARSGCLWVPRPDLATLLVTGSDRLSWLQGIVSSDVEGLSRGQGGWGLVLTKQGKILADVTVVAGESEVYVGLVNGAAQRVVEWLEQFLVMEDASVADASADFGWGMLHGPTALEIARDVLRVTAGDGESAAVDFTGFGGAMLVARRATIAKLGPVLAKHTGVRIGTPDDWLRLRVERLVPITGIDIDDHTSAHEASLERRAVSWTKGCYLGQEAVCMQDMRGKVKRRLATVLLSAGSTPAAGTSVTLPGGAKVGETRSAADSEVLGGPVAIALLAADASLPGTNVVVGDVPASVVELPFSPRAGQGIVEKR